MTTAVSTMDGRAGTAVRVDVRPFAEQGPWLVDQWLYTSVCGHPDCQILVTMGSLDQARNTTPVEGVLTQYSHMVTVHANRDTHKWTPADLAGDAEILSESVFSQPIAVPDDQAARAVCHLLVRDIVAGAVPAQPRTETQRSTWQLAVVMALMANHQPARTRLDPGPKRAEEAPPRDPREPGFPVGRAAGWTGQDREEARNRERG